MPYNGDEISWFFHSTFYEEFFLKRNFDRSVWETYEGYDHPQLSKYIFGGYLYFVQPGIFLERDRLEETYGRWQFYFDSRLDDISMSPFVSYIRKMREVNVVVAWLTLFMLVVLLRQIGVPWIVGCLSALFLVRNQLFVSTMLRATSDGHTMLFLLISLVFFNLFITSKSLLWVVLFAVSAGLSVSSKLTGVLVFLPFLLYQVSGSLFGKKSMNRNLLLIIAVCTIAFMVWLAINPTLYSSPLANTWEYVAFRLRQSVILQHYFPENALFTLISRVYAVFCAVFGICSQDFFQGHLSIWSPIVFLLALLGFIVLIVQSVERQDQRWFILLAIISIILGNGFYLPLQSDRYFLPILVMVFLCFSFGFWWILEKIYKKCQVR